MQQGRSQRYEEIALPFSLRIALAPLSNFENLLCNKLKWLVLESEKLGLCFEPALSLKGLKSFNITC